MGAHLICCRCDQPIRQGQKYEQVDKFSANGGGAILHEHTACKRRFMPLSALRRRL